MHQPVEVLATGNSSLNALLQSHPFVQLEEFTNGENHIEFRRNAWNREIFQSHPAIYGEYGLIELMDNNPLVCADKASAPGAAATLGLIALGPLSKAGILMERPNALFSFDGDYDELDLAMKSVGWNDGVTCAGDPLDFGSVLSGTFLAIVNAQSELEIEELFEEAYGRSFFVRKFQMNELHPKKVEKSPFAHYALSLSPEGILRIQVIADENGKCGAAQMMHLLNIMCGFEEDCGTRQ